MCLGTWFSGGLGSAGLTAGLDVLKGLFKSKLFHDSTMAFGFILHCFRNLVVNVVFYSFVVLVIL